MRAVFYKKSNEVCNFDEFRKQNFPSSWNVTVTITILKRYHIYIYIFLGTWTVMVTCSDALSLYTT